MPIDVQNVMCASARMYIVVVHYAMKAMLSSLTGHRAGAVLATAHAAWHAYVTHARREQQTDARHRQRRRRRREAANKYEGAISRHFVARAHVRQRRVC